MIGLTLVLILTVFVYSDFGMMYFTILSLLLIDYGFERMQIIPYVVPEGK